MAQSFFFFWKWHNLQFLLKGKLTTKYAQTKAEHQCVAEVETRLQKA
jgi:hypothetical protein